MRATLLVTALALALGARAATADPRTLTLPDPVDASGNATQGPAVGVRL